MDRQRKRHPFALEKHLFRRRAAAGQGLANDGGGPHSVFGLGHIRGNNGLRHCLGAGVRLSARLDPVRPPDHSCRRPWRRPQHRLRQYRRHQCAAHRQQGPGRRHAAARRAERHGGGADRRSLCPGARALGRPRRLFRPSLPGLAWLQGRQGGRHLSRRADRSCLAGGADLRPRLAGRRFPVPLFLAGGADGSSRRADRPLCPQHASDCRAVRVDEPDRHHKTPGQHYPAAGRHRGQDRGQGVSQRAAGTRLSDRQRLSWLRLIRTPNVGPATFRDLINRFGSAETALEMLPELMISGGARKIVRIPTMAEAEAELETARRAGARFVGIGEADYPPLMKSMDHAPPMLAVKGEGAVFRLPAVAIVGARTPRWPASRWRARSPPNSAATASASSPAWRAASTRQHIRAALRQARSVCWPAASTCPTRPRMPHCATRLPSAAAPSFQRCRSAGSRAPRIFRAATDLSPVRHWGWSWSRRRYAPAR
ncbi:hypothetical protein MES5069_440101 [Mesorhizobium escarrei]|uniref:Smf/DprA SLOG domain-containing protein n=1 Tax=Mesorhizobium escarrei TaxID=666018 RepID=A0ABN8K824_9HYPH|nr:hypothetical protein MES5069_440101 [Mesorhizobium escarrei]